MTFLKFGRCVCACFFLCLVVFFQQVENLSGQDGSVFDGLMQIAESENDRDFLRELNVKFESIPNELRTAEIKLMLLEEAIPRFDSQALRSFFALEAGRVLTEQDNDVEAQKHYMEAIKSEDMTLLSCSRIVNEHMNHGKFKEAMVYIDQYLKMESIPEALRIELKCHRLLAMLLLGDECNIEDELNAIEVRQPENRIEFFQRLQRIASRLQAGDHRNEALKIMGWVQSKMEVNELNPNFLNSFAFYYERAGQSDKEREKRFLLIEKFPETEDAVWQMSILATQYVRENNLVSMHLAKDLLEQILLHPKASNDYKERAESALRTVDQLIRGGFVDTGGRAIEKEVIIIGETASEDSMPRKRSRYFFLRFFFVIVGIGCIGYGLYHAWSKQKKRI